MEKLFMTDLLPNRLYEKVMICSIYYITKSRLDVQFVKKSPWKCSTDERKRAWSKLIMVFLNFPFICNLSRICYEPQVLNNTYFQRRNFYQLCCGGVFISTTQLY